MNLLTIFFVIAIVLPMFVTARQAINGRYEEWNESRKEFTYIDKYECKNVGDCKELYGTWRRWTCNRVGLCEEEIEYDDGNEHPICNEANCENSCDEGYRCTCNRKRHCILIDDAIFSPDIQNSPLRSSTTENYDDDYNKPEYNFYHTDGHSSSSDVDLVPLP